MQQQQQQQEMMQAGPQAPLPSEDWSQSAYQLAEQPAQHAYIRPGGFVGPLGPAVTGYGQQPTMAGGQARGTAALDARGLQPAQGLAGSSHPASSAGSSAGTRARWQHRAMAHRHRSSLISY